MATPATRQAWKYNKVCDIADFSSPAIARAMRLLMPHLARGNPAYPAGFEHSTVWEYAQVLLGLQHLGAIRAGAAVRSLGGIDNTELWQRLHSSNTGDGPFEIVYGKGAALLPQMHSLLKPLGIAVLVGECVINGAPELETPGFRLFTPEGIRQLSRSIPGLQLMEAPDFSCSLQMLAMAVPLEKAARAWQRGEQIHPFVAAACEGRVYTSISLFFQKRSA